MSTTCFPIVRGFTQNTPQKLLLKLREKIIKVLAKELEVVAYTIQPDFLASLITLPKEKQCVSLDVDAGTLHNHLVGKIEVYKVAEKVATALAESVWKLLDGEYCVVVLLRFKMYRSWNAGSPEYPQTVHTSDCSVAEVTRYRKSD